MEWKSKRPIDARTVKAADIIVSLLNDEEKRLLDIELNGQRITVIEQLCARWWEQVPIADNAFVFRSQAAQILVTNKRWLTLLSKLRQEDFLLKLLEPESYKEIYTKKTTGKTMEKRQIDTMSDNVNLVKTLGRTISGSGGTNRDTDYGSMWDKADRERLDKMQIKKPDRPLITLETGEEDDTRGTDEEEMPKQSNVERWIDKIERLDHTQSRSVGVERSSATFGDNFEEIKEKKIDLFDLGVNHAVSSTVADNAIKNDTLVEAQKRQGFLTLREKMILADAINKIHNVEFPDTREKFFRLFDPLFRRVERICQ